MSEPSGSNGELADSASSTGRSGARRRATAMVSSASSGLGIATVKCAPQISCSRASMAESAAIRR